MSEPEEQGREGQLVCSSLVLSEDRDRSYPSLHPQPPTQTEQGCWLNEGWKEGRNEGTN